MHREKNVKKPVSPVNPVTMESTHMPTHSDETLLALTAQIVSAHVENNTTSSKSLSGLIRDVYRALAAQVGSAGSEDESEEEDHTPPVRTPLRGRPPGSGSAAQSQRESQRASATPPRTVFDDHVVCLECGLHMKMLKRHLQTVHNQTPAQYRAKWNLPGDHPMVARQYAALRSNLAKESGLGKRPASRGR